MTEGPALTFKSAPDPLGSDTCLGSPENDPTLKMAERADWTLFRTVEGLQQKAGVPAVRLRRLVLKELADNALDTDTDIKAGWIGETDTYYVEDDGPGLEGTPEEIASLFSISRPMRSSKLLRLPQRGALGNGLRVVAGAVLASEGSLTIITRDQRIRLRPETDGSTTVVEVTSVEHPVGTRIEISFGSALPDDPNPFAWVRDAADIALNGQSYEGKSSPHWYDPIQFHELLLAHGSQPLRALIAQLDGCSGGKAGEIVTAAGLDRMACASVTRAQAATLLEIACEHVRPVSPERLGSVGPKAYPEHYHAIERDHVLLGSAKPQADIPFVVEAWARKESEKDDITLDMLINRTPVTGEIRCYRDSDKDIILFGCGLAHGVTESPKAGAYDINVNIITPYCPITSDGKAPNLAPFADAICVAIYKAAKKAQRAAPKEKRRSQKDVLLDNLDDAIASCSGGKYLFGERQILYQVRDIVRQETGKPLLESNFKRIITDYENENGEIPLMFREPRGSIYHPHRRETIPLGTLTVKNYERPIWTYNKLCYIDTGIATGLRGRHSPAPASAERSVRCHRALLLSHGQR
jgi:hypothetical protein